MKLNKPQMAGLAVFALLLLAVQLGVVEPAVAPFAFVGVGALFRTDYDLGTKTVQGIGGSESVIVRIVWPQVAALALNDIVAFLPFPEDQAIADLYLDGDRLDSNGAPTLTVSVGILNTLKTDIDTVASGGAAWISGSTALQTATNTIARITTAHAIRIQPFPNQRRVIGMKCAAAPATGVASLTNLTVNRGMWQPQTVYTANDYVTMPNGIRQKCTTGGTSGLVYPQFHTLYNNTTADGTVVWTTADPSIGLTVEFRPNNFGS